MPSTADTTLAKYTHNITIVYGIAHTHSRFTKDTHITIVYGIVHTCPHLTKDIHNITIVYGIAHTHSHFTAIFNYCLEWKLF